MLQAMSKMREQASKSVSASNKDERNGCMNVTGERNTIENEQAQLEEQGAVGGQLDGGSDGSMSDVAVMILCVDICYVLFSFFSR